MEKLVFANFEDMWYYTAYSAKVQDAFTKRWQRAFAQNDKDFKEPVGVKKILQMYDIFLAASHECRKRMMTVSCSCPCTIGENKER